MRPRKGAGGVSGNRAVGTFSVRENLEGEKREGWVLLKISRGDIDGVGEVK